MTENAWIEEGLASDVWGIGKYLEVVSPVEDVRRWKVAVSILEKLGYIAEDSLNDPLLLALTDALLRAEEELARAQDRLERPEGAEVHPRERERIMAMIRRCDALGTATWIVEEATIPNTAAKAATVSQLEELGREASEAFRRYRLECGLPWWAPDGSARRR